MRAVAPITLAYRLGVAARVVAAVAGGYAFAAMAAAALARTLPMSTAEATTLATLIGILAMPAMVVWVFAAKSALRAWGVLLMACGICAAVVWIGGAS